MMKGIKIKKPYFHKHNEDLEIKHDWLFTFLMIVLGTGALICSICFFLSLFNQIK